MAIPTRSPSRPAPLRICRLLAIATFVSCFLASAQTLAQTSDAYIANSAHTEVFTIDTATNGFFRIISVGEHPFGVAVTPDGSKVYITQPDSRSVSVIGGSRLENSRRLIATVPVDLHPFGVAVTPDGSKVYVANEGANSVSVIDTVTNTGIAEIFFCCPKARGVAVSPNGSKVYVANEGADNVSVIDTATDTLTARIPVDHSPQGVAVSPDGTKVYVTNTGSDSVLGSVSVIATATNAVTATIPVGRQPFGVAVSPDGSKVYVTNTGSDNVSVIDTASNAVTATIPVGPSPQGVAVTPDGGKAYVACFGSSRVSGSVSVIATATNTVIPTSNALTSLGRPVSFGKFIGPARQPFTGTPGFSNCEPQSIAALDRQFGGRNAAAAALGFPGVQALENTVLAFCRE